MGQYLELLEESHVQGKLIIFAAPSGAGKTTLVHHLLKTIPNIAFSVSASTRSQRKEEVNGKDYHFMSQSSFKEKIENGEFLEWEEVYPGTSYGTLKSEVERLRGNGKNVIFDVDVVGALNIKEHYGEDALAVFVMPPSIEALRQRLTSRRSESEKTLATRMDKAEKEISYFKQFDVVVYNDDMHVAKEDATRIVSDFLAGSLTFSSK